MDDDEGDKDGSDHSDDLEDGEDNEDDEDELEGSGSGDVVDYEEILKQNEHFDNFGRIYSTGRRKTSVARVWIQEGSGQFIINGKRISDYFQVHPREHVLTPFLATRSAGFFDVWCTVKGGGTLGGYFVLKVFLIYLVFELTDSTMVS